MPAWTSSGKAAESPWSTINCNGTENVFVAGGAAPTDTGLCT